MEEEFDSKEGSVNEDSDIMAVVISGDSDDPTVLAETHVQAHDRDSMRLLILARGGITMQTDRIVETYGEPASGASHMVMDDEILAIGIFIQMLELHELDEDFMYDSLKDTVPDLYAEYKAFLKGLDESDRQLRLLDQAEAANKRDPLYEDVLQQGKWRTVTHDRDLQGFARALHRRFDFDSSGCYRNARLVMQDDRYWENDSVQYVEGIGLSKHASRITGHGWIEHDGRVVELTWPWHSPVPPKGTTYFGRPVSRKELQESWNRGEGGPYILKAHASVMA